MTFGSLFAGIGGIDLGLERAGLVCRWQVEIDPFCTEVLERRWPKVKRYGDIRTVHGADLEPVDLLCGGFPCQDLSQAGKRAGIEGSRSGLWFEFARLIGELRPRYVLIENVPGLLVYDAMRRVLGDLSRCGYDAVWRCLRASEFGARQLRKRVFIVAVLADAQRTERRAHHEHEQLPGGRIETADRPWSDGEELAELAARNWETGPRHVWPGGRGEDFGMVESVADARYGFLQEQGRGAERRNGAGSTGEILSDAGRTGLPDPERESVPGARRGIEGGAATELCGAHLADAERESFRAQQLYNQGERAAGATIDGPMPGIAGPGSGGSSLTRAAEFPGPGNDAGLNLIRFAPGPSDSRWPFILAERPDLAPALESPLCRVADGLSDWMDGAMSERTKRLGRLGNSVVPAVAEYVGRCLMTAAREANER